jgi:hypothetical protein
MVSIPKVVCVLSYGVLLSSSRPRRCTLSMKLELSASNAPR